MDYFIYHLGFIQPFYRISKISSQLLSQLKKVFVYFNNGAGIAFVLKAQVVQKIHASTTSSKPIFFVFLPILQFYR